MAKLNNRSYDMEWPCNPLECPDDLRHLPSRELSFIISIYQLLEKRVFIRTARRARGPVTTSLSVVASVNTTVSFLSVLNVLGITTSYQYIDTMRHDTIDDWKECGPFTTLAPGAFVAVGIDNINMRAKNSLAVHGGTYHGFDGLAMQAMNCNESFNFDAYCKSRSPEENLPKRLKLSRKDFIEDNFPSANDFDITGYRYLVVCLAVKNRKSIATRDRTKQKASAVLFWMASKALQAVKRELNMWILDTVTPTVTLTSSRC